ncbi:MAG: RelA/SpoT domain-containing protein, partial [Nostocoides sp.]
MRRKDIDRSVSSYAERQPGLVAASEAFVELVTSIIDDAGINYLSVTGRAKGVASFAGKVHRLASARDDPFDPLVVITDQVGLRVITYVEGDVLAVADLLRQQFTVLEERDLGKETASEGRFGYASRHLLVS